MTMQLPAAVAKHVQEAYSSVISHSKHALAPIYRKRIYQAFSSTGKPTARAWLAVITARYVLPTWQSARPLDSLASEVIETATARLHGLGDIALAEEIAGAAWKTLERLGTVTAIPAVSDEAWFAGEAAVAALFEALGRDPFADIEISVQHTDEDLDPWGSDTALWAAAAFAGGIGDPTSDAIKRLAFWSWWLTEAIPSAWHANASG